MKHRVVGLSLLLSCLVGLMIAVSSGVVKRLPSTSETGSGEVDPSSNLVASSFAAPPRLVGTEICGGRVSDSCCKDQSCSGEGLVCDRTKNHCVSCGKPGDICCAERMCESGGCCLTGRCFAQGSGCGGGREIQGICKEGRCGGCGGIGQSCCTGGNGIGESCLDPRTTCVSGPTGRACRACGDVDQPCCAGEDEKLSGSGCSDGLICHGEMCRKCNVPGTPRCCENGACAGQECCVGGLCVAEGKNCNGENLREPLFGICRTGRCRCGGLNEPCCGNLCDDPKTECGSNTLGGPLLCLACGQPGGRCCADNICSGGCCIPSEEGISMCVAHGQQCGKGLELCQANGACSGCGGKGDPCCEFKEQGFCSATRTTCALPSKRCVECGDEGQSCCFGMGYFANYEDGQCFGKDQKCWPESQSSRKGICKVSPSASP